MPSYQTPPSKKRAALPLIIGGVVLLGVAAFFIFHHGDDDGGAPAPKNEIKMVTVPPLPPPPPPPPKPEPPKPDEPKFQKEKTPDEKPPEQPPEPAPISTSIQGNDASGLALGNGGGGGGRGFGGGGHGSKFGYYAGQVKARILDALRNHKKTRSAVMDVQVRVWLDETGRVSKVKLSQSTGNPDVDNAIKNEAMAEISMPEAPPQGMPMPIVMHLSAKRPN